MTLDMQNTEHNHASYDGIIDQSKDFLTVVIADQTFGIPILQIQDVLGEQSVTKIPLSPVEIAGSLNLRGRIVTAINVRSRLGIERRKSDKNRKNMSVVVEHENELYSLIIDSVGDVLTLKDNKFEPMPATLDPAWQEMASGIYRLQGQLLVILDIPKFLEAVHTR